MSIITNSSLANSRFAEVFRIRKLAGILPCLLAATLLAGCAHRYDIVLTNGDRVTNVTKPVLHRDEGVFIYKDVTGREHHVSAGRVVDIGPHSSKNNTPGTMLQ